MTHKRVQRFLCKCPNHVFKDKHASLINCMTWQKFVTMKQGLHIIRIRLFKLYKFKYHFYFRKAVPINYERKK